jgi:GNAT superfamily N-acetyltransferase
MKNVIESLKFYFSTGTVLVALDGNKIVGTAVFLIELWREGPVVLLEDIAVRNDYKKKGVGKFLMEHVEDIGCKCGAVMVCFSTHKNPLLSGSIQSKVIVLRDTVFMRKNLSSSR